MISSIPFFKKSLEGSLATAASSGFCEGFGESLKLLFDNSFFIISKSLQKTPKTRRAMGGFMKSFLKSKQAKSSKDGEMIKLEEISISPLGPNEGSDLFKNTFRFHVGNWGSALYSLGFGLSSISKILFDSMRRFRNFPIELMVF